MPPKKIINPKQVTNPLTSFFNPLTKHEIAVNKAKIDLENLDDRMRRETDEVNRKELSSRIEEGIVTLNGINDTTARDVVNTLANVIQIW